MLLRRADSSPNPNRYFFCERTPPAVGDTSLNVTKLLNRCARSLPPPRAAASWAREPVQCVASPAERGLFASGSAAAVPVFAAGHLTAPWPAGRGIFRGNFLDRFLI